jgi:hypothetical protein
MAKVLASYEFKSFGSNGGSKLPWSEWADGKIRQLQRGEDFECKGVTVATMARSYAKKNGLKVKVSHKKGSDVVVLQFSKGSPEPTPAPATPKKKSK